MCAPSPPKPVVPVKQAPPEKSAELIDEESEISQRAEAGRTGVVQQLSTSAASTLPSGTGLSIYNQPTGPSAATRSGGELRVMTREEATAQARQAQSRSRRVGGDRANFRLGSWNKPFKAPTTGLRVGR
jgi:hypothetical protein